MIRITALDSLLRRMADRASLVLDPAERDSVFGDLAESGESGSQALRGVLGLVIRRRAPCLWDWRQWFTVASLTVPLSALVSLQSRRSADGTAIYLWLYVNNWDWALIHSSGFWRVLAQCAPGVLLSYISLACWSWTAGLLVGWFARRTLWFNSFILFAVVVAVGLFGIPPIVDHIFVLHRARDYPGNAAVFFVRFYRQVFPQCLQLLLVMLPAWRGMLHGRRFDQFPRSCRVVVLIAAVAAAGALVSTNLLGWQMRVLDIWPLRQPRLPSLVPMAIAGPAAYLLVTSLVRRARRYAGHS
jgi:hypothetical protein